MMVLIHLSELPIFVTLFSAVYIFCLAFEVDGTGSVDCNKAARICGNNSVSYPFGFTDSCPIRLNCSASDGGILIGEFKVQNVTGDSILVNVPMNCSRLISDIYPLFGSNYAINSQNGLLLEGCESIPEYCFIPNILGEDKVGFQKCDRIDSNISCYSNRGSGEFMSREEVELANCRVLLTSVAIDIPPNTSNFTTNSPVSLRFQSVKLGWWIIGNCSCSDNATCSPVKIGEDDGFRCQCLEGFQGDGFASGERCRKVEKCRGGLLLGQCVGSAKVIILIGGIVLGASLMAITAFSFYIIKRKSKSLRTQMSAKRLLTEVTGISSSVHLYPYKEIEKATNYFSEKQRLGTGAYGTVYSGKLVNDELVAIKKIRHRDSDGIEQVKNEIKLLSSVSHTNLVRLLGCCIEKGQQILVFEFMPNGTLAQHLQGERGKGGLPWRTRLTIATETAQAIAYLHSMNPPIFHRDIKSSNILLDYSFKSKVADFGLSRLGMEVEDNSHSHVSTAPQGTPGYVDPQYHQNYHLSDKSDVYSFGVVLIEIITGMKAIDFSRSHTDVNLANLAIDMIGKGRLDEIIDPLLEPYRDAWTLSSIHKVAEMAFRCLAFHRDMRPSMTEVAEELDRLRLNGWPQMDDNACTSTTSATYTCSSPFNGSEKSLSSVSHNSITLRQQSGFTRY